MKTFVIVEITHAKPIPHLDDLVANRAYTIDGVSNANSFAAGEELIEEIDAMRPDGDREQVLIKLLAIEPDTRDQLIKATGWDADETTAILDRLVARGEVGWRNGPAGAGGRRLYFSKRHQPGDWHEGPNNGREPKPKA
jgi:hypothetical protein